MEDIIYRGNIIRKWNDGTFTSYVMDRYGDIEDYTRETLEDAKAIIDLHLKGQKITRIIP